MCQKEFKPISLDGVSTHSINDRYSKVSKDDLAKCWSHHGNIGQFIDTLPNILAARDLKRVINKITNAYLNDKVTCLGMGAHVIKVGLGPIITDLMKRGVISAVAMNGAGIIHDMELALTGQTSEDVAASLEQGTFGMAKETCEFLSQAIHLASKTDSGLGAAVGKGILDQKMPYRDKSILATAVKLNIPVTVHIAMGTDIIHMHPQFDAAAAGAASHYDFRLFTSVVSKLSGGVYLNVGSAVILPEVFLKALTVARNLGNDINSFTTVNMDFIRHYRPMTNVVHRPTAGSGCGINLVGHHEIMFPLLAAGIIERIAPVE